MSLRFTILIISVYTVLVINSCTEEQPVSPQPVGEHIIGTEGGTIELPDGAKIEIQQGALASDQSITFTEVLEQNINTDSKIYELGPDGLQFQDSVILTLPYNYDKIPIPQEMIYRKL